MINSNHVSIDIDIENNTDIVLEALEKQLQNGLNAIGLKMEAYAKSNCPVDTGRLRNSITYATNTHYGGYQYSDNIGNEYSDSSNQPTDTESVYVGTNVEYAPKMEFFDMTHKIGRAHFLRDSVSAHGDEYKKIMEAALKA